MSSAENEDESDCSSSSSRNEDISDSIYLAKLKEKNISIRNFKIVLLNGCWAANKESDPTPELEKEAKFSAACDSVSSNNDKVVFNPNNLSANIDKISTDSNRANDSGSSDFEFDDKCWIDEKTEKVHCPSYLATHLENITIPDAVDEGGNNDGGNRKKCKKRTCETPIFASSEPNIQSLATEFNCTFCEKKYPSKTSLKFHVLSHLKSFLHQDGKDNGVVSTSDMDTTAVDSVDHASSDLACVFCEKSFASLTALRMHYKVDHRAAAQKGSPQNNRRSSPSSMSTVNGARHKEDDVENGCQDGSKQYKCHICGKRFKRHSSLTWHIQFHETYTHSKLKKNNTGLENGLNPGNGETVGKSLSLTDPPFCCPVCGKVYESLAGYRRHLANHGIVDEDASSLSKRCQFCNKYCPSVVDLKRHIIFMHKDQLPLPSVEDVADGVEASASYQQTQGLSNSVASDAVIMDTIPCDAYVKNEDGSFQCTVCDRIFESRKGVIRHVGYHRSVLNAQLASHNSDAGNDDNDDEEAVEDGILCPVCEKTFNSMRGMRIHANSHTVAASTDDDDQTSGLAPSGVGKIYQCRHCPLSFTKQQAMACHMKAHKSQKATVRCQLDQPQRSSSRGKTGKSYSRRVYGQPNSAKKSLAASTNSCGQRLTLEDTIECDMCGKCFIRKQDVAKHMRDHIKGVVTKENVDLSQFQCIYCAKSFVGRKSLNTHQVLHEEAQVALKRAANELLSGAPPAKLHRLNDVAATAASAAQDELIGWDDMVGVNGCDGSGVAPAEEKELIAFAARERFGTPFECLFCHISFHTKELLVEHTSIHEAVSAAGLPTVVDSAKELGERAVVKCVYNSEEETFEFEQREGGAYQCSECDEVHFNKLQLIVHMAYHKSQRWASGRQRALTITVDPLMLAPFKCIFCHERFLNKAFRGQHVLQRHGDLVLKCDSCKKIFLSKRTLSAHCRQHLADSVYRCQQCLKTFSSKWFLKRHARKQCVCKSSPEMNETMLPQSDVQLKPLELECQFCGSLVSHEGYLAHLQSHMP